jgi:serine/threonine-protein kinase
MAEATGATTPAPSAESGPRTDRLELLQQYGGTVGVVHKARNPKLNRVVALRQLQVPEWLDDAEDLIKRILTEARGAGALDRPNIARLYTAGYKGFTVFLTSEFVEGPNINEFVASQKLGVPQIVELGKQLCAALEFAHQKKILHYALNPANLKVLPNGTLKILDFGLLRDKQLYSPTPAKRLESEHYLSPEQLRNKPIDVRANLFSAASIIYELLTTRNPFAGKHLGEVDRNITDIDPAPAAMAHPRVPEALSKVLIKALAKDPAARFQTAAEFSTALEEALNPSARPVAAAPALSTTPSASSTGTRPAAPVIPINSARSTTVAVPSNGEQIKPQTPAKPQAPDKPPTVQIPKPATTMMRAQPAPAALSKIPVKILTQWKLVAAAVAVVFVVSAMAISLNHRSKVSSKPSDAAPSEQQQQPIQVISSDGGSVAQPQIEVREVQPRTGKSHTARTQPVTLPAATAEGQMMISSEPDGANIIVEGRPEQSWKTPQVISSLTPGTYRITISKAGYASETRSIQVLGGNRASLDVKLNVLKASLTIGGTPGARIMVDGRDTGKFSPAEFNLDPAVHNISLHKEGYFDSTTDIKLAPGQAASYSPMLKQAGRTDNIKVVGGGFKRIFGGGSSEGMSRIEIKSEPKGAQITVNGTTLSKTTPLEIQVEPGNYEITLQKDGYKSLHKSVTTQANDKLKLDETLAQ